MVVEPAFLQGSRVRSHQNSNVTPMTPRGRRTPEQIREQFEARYAEMEREAAQPEMQMPCASCRWKVSGFKCEQPLVKGFNKEPFPNVDWQRETLTHEKGRLANNWPTVKLCGHEKALFEPKPPKAPKRTIWQRFIDWFLQPWKDVG